ncbi:hypothetical protein LguiB_035855 [Lonicera macranthoides]
MKFQVMLDFGRKIFSPLVLGEKVLVQIASFRKIPSSTRGCIATLRKKSEFRQ